MDQQATLIVPRLVTMPREAFLRKNETRLRSQALPLRNDPAIARHLDAIEMAEDLKDIHEIAAKKMADSDRPAWHRIHTKHSEAAFQLQLHHLDQLAHLIGI